MEAQISDTGSAWSARARPGHPDEPTEAS
ncbi:MAG TPA: hypothetical protein PK264_21570 [Hyphomicrobiaceae bacterium]|nr:hypothetical protein [Hyphomicrobiaceae bacterium]